MKNYLKRVGVVFCLVVLILGCVEFSSEPLIDNPIKIKNLTDGLYSNNRGDKEIAFKYIAEEQSYTVWHTDLMNIMQPPEEKCQAMYLFDNYYLIQRIKKNDSIYAKFFIIEVVDKDFRLCVFSSSQLFYFAEKNRVEISEGMVRVGDMVKQTWLTGKKEDVINSVKDLLRAGKLEEHNYKQFSKIKTSRIL